MFNSVAGNESANDAALVAAAIPAADLAALVAKYRSTPTAFQTIDVHTFARAYGVSADNLFGAVCRLADAELI
jgi:hypothetical protein